MSLVKSSDSYIGLIEIFNLIKLNIFKLTMGIILGLLISSSYIFLLNKQQKEYIVNMRSMNYMLGGINFHNSSILLEDVAVALDDLKFAKTKTRIPNNITLLGKVNQGGFNQLTELNFKHKFSPEELSNLSNYLDDLFYEISSTLIRKQLLNIEYLLNVYAVSLPFEAKVLREELKLNSFLQNGLDDVYRLSQKTIEIKNRLAFIDNFDAQLWLGCISKIRIQLENKALPPFDARFLCPLMSDKILSELLGTLNAYQKLRSNYFTASIKPTGVSDRPLLILFFGALFGFFVPFFIISFRRR